MGRRGKVALKRNTRRRIRSKEEGSEESDEDYRVGADEEFDESDEYGSLDGDEFEESLDEFDLDADEEEQELKVKVVRSKARKNFPSRKANGFKKTRKKKRVLYKQEDDDDYDDDDEEFMPDKIDYIDDEDEKPVMKKNKKAGRTRLLKKGFAKGRKRKRNSKVLKRPMRKKSRKKRRLVRRTSSVGDFTDKNLVVEEKSKKLPGGKGRRGFMAYSDTDYVSSGSSDYEYTISEEEREQVREASKFCTSLTTSLRSSSSSNRLQETSMHQQRKSTGRKGKEKVEDLKNETGKQVCGICLSEEGKKTVRGTLNCCSHYFCFACIMEWSNVESRCPLCKQRFVTISKLARSNTGFDLRTVAIQVPERDQVYQPSEEELRGYLDPYESMICIECQRGGDDALMLLCDICDSPAHTYCVGLGHEVPEGNWYCEGCRPTAVVSSTPQGLNYTPDQSAINNLSAVSSPVHNIGEGIDLNSTYVPDTPLTQETENFFTSRNLVGDLQSPTSGLGAFTVSERRRINRLRFVISNRSSHSGGISNGISGTNSEVGLFGSQLNQGREIPSERAIMPERVVSDITFSDTRLPDNSTPLVHNRDNYSARSSYSRGQGQNPTSTSVDGASQAELAGINMYNSGEGRHLNVQKEQVQQMVRSNLKTLSRDIGLGYSTFKDIARSSTHTILAACGLEHRESEVYPVRPPSICNHLEQQAGMQTGLMEARCSYCFDSFVKAVVREIMNTRVSPRIRN